MGKPGLRAHVPFMEPCSGVGACREVFADPLPKKANHAVRNQAVRMTAWSFVAVLALIESACAHQMGKNAAQGATQVLAEGQAATSDDQTKQISRIMA